MGGRCVGHGSTSPLRSFKIFHFDHWCPPRVIFLLLLSPPVFSVPSHSPSYHSHLQPMLKDPFILPNYYMYYAALVIFLQWGNSLLARVLPPPRKRPWLPYGLAARDNSWQFVTNWYWLLQPFDIFYTNQYF